MTALPVSHSRGVLLMLGAMAFFAATDVFIKLNAGTISPAHTTLLLMGGGCIVFGLMALIEGHSLRDRRAFAPILLVRYLCEMAGAFGLVLALAHAPLPAVAAIMQAGPLVVTLAGLVFLGERVRGPQWLAIGVGFFGVLLIIQPWGAGFTLALVWPVISMLGFAGRDVTTRLTPPGMGSSALATFTMIAALPGAVLWCVLAEGQVLPDRIPLIPTLGMVGCGALAYMLLIAATRSTALSVLAPFRYARLIFLMVLGLAVFGEWPTPLTVLGAVLIVGSGLFSMGYARRGG